MNKTITSRVAIAAFLSIVALSSCAGTSNKTSEASASSAPTPVSSSVVSDGSSSSSKATKIPAPVLTLNANVVSWGEVENARLYQIKVGTDSYETNETSFTIEKTVPGSWDVMAKALAEGSAYADSDWSNTLTYTLQAVALAAPVLTLDGATVAWGAIDHAEGYDVYVNDQKVSSQTATYYEIDKEELGTYVVGVKATSASALFTESALSNTVTFKIEASELAIPVVSNKYNVFSWDAVANADSYDVYVNDTLAKNVTTTSIDLDVHAKGSYKVEVEAKSKSDRFTASGKSKATTLTVGGTVEEANSVYDEAFTQSIRIDGGTYAVVMVEDATAARVWLRYFVKTNSTSVYNIKLLQGSSEITVLDSTTIENETIVGKGVDGAVNCSTSTGFELAARRFDGNSDIVLGANYKFIVANETVGTTITLLDFRASSYPSDVVSERDSDYNLNVNGNFLQNVDDMNDIFYYNCWIPHSTIAIDFNAWAVVDYDGTFKGVNKTNSGQSVPNGLSYQSMSKAIQLPALTLDHYVFGMNAGNVGPNESALIWKISAVCEETGKVYAISDWAVNAFDSDTSFSFAFGDDDSKELSGKKIDLTVQWQRQENYNDGWKARAYLSAFALTQASTPTPVTPHAWEVTSGTGSYDASAEVPVKSETFEGLLSLSAGASAALAATIDEGKTSNVWVSFYAKAAPATDTAAVPSIEFKLSAKIGDDSFVIYNWNKIGGTSSVVDNSSVVTAGSVNQAIANDRYEIFMISLDEFAFGYAGKNASFLLETRDSNDGTEQKLFVTGFNLIQYTTKMGVSSAYQGMGEWTSNFSSYVEFGNYPLPGGWLRCLACTDSSKVHQYQGDVADVTMPTYEEGKTMKFGFTFSNYGNYTSILYKLSAVDEDGNVYILNDWGFFAGPGSDVAFTKAIPSETAQAISGKSVSLLLQFNDSEMIDSPYQNRLYMTAPAFMNV